HGRKEWNVGPKPEPFAGEETIGDFILAIENFVGVDEAGIFFQELFVFLERAFVQAVCFVALADDVLGLRRVVRKGPNLDRAPGGFEGGAVILFIESVLGDDQLILGAGALPIASAADRF